MFEKGTSPENNIDDLEWLVENRSRNQKSTLRIYRTIIDHKEKINGSQSLRGDSQMLLGVAFSLWRAVFLADIKKVRGSLMLDVEGFLLELIQNNAIAYNQDRKNRNWTFRYYVQNASDRLKRLQARFENKQFNFNMPGDSKGKTPQQWWVMHQDSLDDAIMAFNELVYASNARTRPARKPRGTPKNSN